MRYNRHRRMMDVANVIASGSTCARRTVGCVLIDSRGKILATGYNGVASGMRHCNEGFECTGANALSGTRLDSCEAIHAEANALLQCSDVQAIHCCYVTVSPCVSCVKLLMNTGCKNIIYETSYAHDASARQLWQDGPGIVERRWIRVNDTSALLEVR